MKKRTCMPVALFVSVLAAVALVMASLAAEAATETEIEDSIDQGLAWLAGQQNLNGSWGTYEQVAHTGFVVMKMEDRAVEMGYDPFDPEYMYSDNITAGLDYIFDWIQADGSITTNVHHANYNTAIAAMAICGSRHPEMLEPAGLTYQQVVENAVNYLISGQAPNGGWGYNIGNADGSWTDNSNSGYVTLALITAQNLFGVDVSAVLPGLEGYVDYIQNPVDGDSRDGGSGYTAPDVWVNSLKTGNLLFQMAMVEYTTADTRVQDAIDYLERHWNDADTDPGWKGGLGFRNYQAMYTIMKGFTAQGVESIEVGVTEIDWFAEISDIIIGSQNGDGSWSNDPWGNPILATSWALLALERVVEVPVQEVYVDIKPGSCPNPVNTKSNGVLLAAILGGEDFDVMTIDPATIVLSREDVEEAVYPLRWDYEDVATPFEGELCDCHDLNGDGYMDLTLKFRTKDLLVLGLKDLVSETVPLTINANLLEEEGGGPIKGQDCVWIVK